MKIKYVFLLALIPFFLASCASTVSPPGSTGGKKPTWVDDKHSMYPDETYLVEIGEGNSLRSAKQDGQASLARIFRTAIIVDSTVSTRYKDLSDGNTILESQTVTTADQSITQLSDETLINVHFAESWTSDMGSVYVVAYIDRMETANIYRQRIKQDGMKAEDFISESSDQSDLLRRYGFLDAAMVMDQKIASMKNQLEIIHQPFARMIQLPYEPADLHSSYADVAEQMQFSINIEDDSEDKVTSVVSQVLTNRGFTVTEGESNLSVTGRVLMEEVSLNNDYENMRWTLFLEMRNEKGDVVVSMDEKKRETAISKEEARSRSYRSMEEVMEKKFLRGMESYFDSFAMN